MTLEQRGAAEMLQSASRYLCGKSYVGDDAMYFCPSSEWMKSLTEAVRHLKECRSLILLLSGKESLCQTTESTS